MTFLQSHCFRSGFQLAGASIVGLSLVLVASGAMAAGCENEDLFAQRRLKSVCDARSLAQACGEAEAQQVWLDGDGLPDIVEGGTWVIISQDRLPLYQSGTGAATLTLRGLANLGTRVELLDYQGRTDTPWVAKEGGRGRIKLLDTGEEAWIDLSGLLCRIRPLVDEETGLSQRAVLKGAGDSAKKLQIPTYTTPTQVACEDACPVVSAFQVVNVIDRVAARRTSDGRTVESLLVGTQLSLRNVGREGLFWISSEDAAPWQSALMIRPHPRLNEAQPASEGRVCIYADADSARRGSTDCPDNHLVGGPKWFYESVHAPVIDETEDGLYKVVIAIDAAREVVRTETIPNFDNLASTDTMSDFALSGYSNVDVFFLIDGSKSMRDHRDSIVHDFIPAVYKALEQKLQAGASLRMGFRIFTDTVEGRPRSESVKEGTSLQASDCDYSQDPNIAIRNDRARQKLQEAGFSERADDYHEDLYGGLIQAADDLRDCPDNLKFLFVIGDAGYEAKWHRDRQFAPHSMARVLNSYRTWTEDGSLPSRLIPFFIRGVPLSRPTSNPNDFDRAYASFRRDAEAFIGSFKVAPGRFLDEEEFGGRAADQVVGQMLDILKTFVDPDAVSEVGRGLATGSSVDESIRIAEGRLQGSMSAVFRDYLRAELCRRSPNRCTGRNVAIVDTVYLRPDDSFMLPGEAEPVPRVLPELWLSLDTFERMDRFLGDFHRDTQFVLEAGRNFQFLLKQILDQVLPEPLPSDADADRLASYFARGAGIPLRKDSPLLQYRLSDFAELDAAQAHCELNKLRDWIDTSRRLISRAVSAYANTEVIVDPREAANDLICPGRYLTSADCGLALGKVTERGRHIPIVEAGFRQQGPLFTDAEIDLHRQRWYSDRPPLDLPEPGYVHRGPGGVNYVTLPQCFAP